MVSTAPQARKGAAQGMSGTGIQQSVGARWRTGQKRVAPYVAGASNGEPLFGRRMERSVWERNKDA